MKSRLVIIDERTSTYQALMFWCPGCPGREDQDGSLHMLPVNSSSKSPSWTWNGDLEFPTLEPSILTKTKPYVDGKPTGICHSFLRAGVFEFLGDCTHKYAGQKVPMPDLPDWVTKDSDQ